MKAFRFSLWSAFLAIAAICIACAALAKPTAIWAIALQATTLGVLSFAILASLVYERGAARAFWIGLAVIGWGHLGLQRFPLSEVNLTQEISSELMAVLHPQEEPPAVPPPAITTAALSYSYSEPTYSPTPASSGAEDPSAEKARDVFPYVICWIWPISYGFLGGIVAQQLYLRRARLALRAPSLQSEPS